MSHRNSSEEEERKTLTCVCCVCRDWTEEVQIKKTVDTWINTLSSDFQVSAFSTFFLVQFKKPMNSDALATALREIYKPLFSLKLSQLFCFFFSSKTHGPPSPPQAEKSARCRSADTGTSQQRAAGRGRPMSVLRATGAKPVMERGSRGKRAGHKTVILGSSYSDGFD